VGQDGHQWDAADVLTHFFEGLLIDEHLFAFALDIVALYFYFLPGFYKGGFVKEKMRIFLYGMFVLAAAKAPGEGEVVQRIEYVGFARAIGPADAVDARAEFQVLVLVIAKLSEMELPYIQDLEIKGYFCYFTPESRISQNICIHHK